MPCPILYILTARINITGSNKGMKKKTGRQRYMDRKLVVWALSWRSLSTPTQHGFEERQDSAYSRTGDKSYCIQINKKARFSKSAVFRP